jgi:hypothetical protein
MTENLNDRLFEFAKNVLKLLPCLPKTPEFNVIRYQLTKSATSSGANYSPRQIWKETILHTYLKVNQTIILMLVTQQI